MLDGITDSMHMSFSKLRVIVKEMATLSSTLAWEIPRAEGPGGLQSTGSDTTERACTHGEGSPPFTV